jgi:hypothetical protein
VAQNPITHRKVQIAGFAADDDWSLLQGSTPPANLPHVLPDLNVPIDMTDATKLMWWAVGRDGNSPAAKTVDGSGLTFDAAVILETTIVGASGVEYVRWRSVLEGLGVLGTNGIGLVELDIPFASRAYIRMISLAGGGSPATHLWLNFVAAGNRYT